MRKAVFLDRDGTLNEDTGYPHKVKDLRILPGVIEGLQKLSDEFIFIIITNQSGIGKGIFKERQMHSFNRKLLSELKKNEIHIEKIYFCAHAPDHGCDCRKPHIKFMQQAASDFDIDIANSWMIGDHPHDVEMAQKAGARGMYLLTGHGNIHRNDLWRKGIEPAHIANTFMDAANFIFENSIKPKDIQARPDQHKKIRTIEEIRAIASELKRQGKKIVTTNGVFDILHIGHIRYLQEARRLGDALIIAVNSDSSVRENKGPKRPINSQQDRMEALAALACVDHVVLFSEKTPVLILEKIQPDIHVKGGDYSMDKIIERKTVERSGGRIILMPHIKGYATTKLIEKIVAAYGKKRP